MIEEFAEFVQKRPIPIILAILLITALFLIPLSKIEVDSSTKLFMPKSVLEPLEKFEKLVSNPVYQSIYVLGKGHESMLSVEALKEQLELTDFLHSNFDVETVSTAEIIEKELNENYNKSIMEIESKEELNEAIYGLFEKSPGEFKRLAESSLDRLNYLLIK
jgi:predicted RND superfamily exporter protein